MEQPGSSRRAGPARRNTAALVWHQVRYEQLGLRSRMSGQGCASSPSRWSSSPLSPGVFRERHARGTRPAGSFTGLQYYTSTIVAVSVMSTATRSWPSRCHCAAEGRLQSGCAALRYPPG